MTTAAKLRDTILRCAREAIQAEPSSVEFRLHSFIAKMSGSMEVMGERELDESLWKLLEAKPAAQPGADTQAGIEWWNSLTEERRAHWMLVAASAVPADAWKAFCESESTLAVDG
ncbi:hypothetical protein [Massilia varians]|uniref:hypothetical protein n=1 Tax=Massilia varians TaxID=457921 RepID=UPI00255513C9|nr:hypothetical protein [Massilia varians]MDK6078947.1 hypothetical protein [Massilia varians]